MNSNKQKAYDEWLVLQCQLGDQSALNELLTHWRKKFVVYAMNQVHNTAAAEDISQECLIAVSKGIKRIKDPSCFPKWAYQILVRRVNDWIRTEIKTRDIKSQVEQKIVNTNKSQAPTNEYALLVHCINTIEPEILQLIRLFYIESFSIKDISEILDIPCGTVKSRLFYARKKFEKHLEENQHE